MKEGPGRCPDATDFQIVQIVCGCCWACGVVGNTLVGESATDQGEEGRWRFFTREQIMARNDNLDIAWLRDTEAEAEEQLTEPEDIAAAIIGHLKAALEEIETLAEELEPDSVDEVSAVHEAAE